MRKARGIPVLMALIATISLSACSTDQSTAGSNSSSPAPTTSAAAQPSEAPATASGCLTANDFARELQAAEKRAADTLGMAPGKLSIKVESDVACQDGFAAAWATVTQLANNPVASIVPGKWAMVLRQKSVRTGVPSDTEWEAIGILPKKTHSSICTMPPPPAVNAWLKAQDVCTG